MNLAGTRRWLRGRQTVHVDRWTPRHQTCAPAAGHHRCAVPSTACRPVGWRSPYSRRGCLRPAPSSGTFPTAYDRTARCGRRSPRREDRMHWTCPIGSTPVILYAHPTITAAVVIITFTFYRSTAPYGLQGCNAPWFIWFRRHYKSFA